MPVLVRQSFWVACLAKNAKATIPLSVMAGGPAVDVEAASFAWFAPNYTTQQSPQHFVVLATFVPSWCHVFFLTRCCCHFGGASV